MLCAPFILPIWGPLHFGMSIFLTVWAVSIHDNLNFVPCGLILYAGHHSIHHDKGRRKNYGQFLSICDKIWGSYEAPPPEVFPVPNTPKKKKL